MPQCSECPRHRRIGMARGDERLARSPEVSADAMNVQRTVQGRRLMPEVRQEHAGGRHGAARMTYGHLRLCGPIKQGAWKGKRAPSSRPRGGREFAAGKCE